MKMSMEMTLFFNLWDVVVGLVGRYVDFVLLARRYFKENEKLYRLTVHQDLPFPSVAITPVTFIHFPVL